MSIKVKSKGSFNKTKAFLYKLTNLYDMNSIIKILDKAIDQLKKASPSEEVAKKWEYEIINNGKHLTIYINNLEIQNGNNIAIILDNGHVSQEGKWIPGKNYIQKPIDEAFVKIINNIMEELKRV